jgi:phage terminase small subunit
VNNKQRVFVDEYLKCWNATEAARRAGYAHAHVQGPRLLSNVSVAPIVKARISEKAMSADEVLTRLGEHARGDMGDFLDISSMAHQVDLAKAKELGLTRLIKKVNQRTTTTLSKDGVETETNYIEIELYDAQAALVHLGKHHGLFKEIIETTERINLIWDLPRIQPPEQTSE